MTRKRITHDSPPTRFGVFYPLGYNSAQRLLEPDGDVESAIAPDTLGIHLWHSALTERGSSAPAKPRPGSYLWRQAERLGIAL